MIHQCPTQINVREYDNPENDSIGFTKTNKTKTQHNMWRTPLSANKHKKCK